MYSTGSPHTQQKGEEKGDHSYEKQVPKTTKENTNLQKGLYPHEDHIYGQRKMSKETNDLSKPFQKKKNTQRKGEKPLRIHFRHFKNGPLIFLPHPKLSNQSTNKFEKYQLNVLQENFMKSTPPRRLQRREH